MLKLRRMICCSWIMRVLLLGIVLLLPNPMQAQSCRLALVLALDVSGSVNPREYAQQVDGVAAALNDPDVRSLILFGADAPVALAVFEWSSRNHQYVIQPWVMLDSPAALDQAIVRIAAHQRLRAGLKTALGTALTKGAAMMEERSACWHRTIDVSGDGGNNIGITPADVYATGAFADITVNALVIGDPSDDEDPNAHVLKAYYESKVIHGENAFAMVADGYRDYARAMRRKLLKELALPTLGQLRLREN